MQPINQLTTIKAMLRAATLLLHGVQNVSINAEAMPDIDFVNYKTYVWAQQMNSTLEPSLYFLNNLKLEQRIRGVIGYAMDGRVYECTRQAPDLVINLRVVKKRTLIQPNVK